MSASDGQQRILRAGFIGLGGAAKQMIPKFARTPGFKVAGAADLDAEILGRFKQDYPDAETHTSAEGLCESKNIDIIYIGTPNRFHREHAVMAADGGKHVLVEKPMAVNLAEADAMVEASDRNKVLIGVNVKHSFEPRIQKLRELTETGELGALRMMHHWRYQDWLYRPRTPEELTPEWAGGILWRQGGHQLDLLRTIGLGMVRSVRGSAMVWDAARRVPGAHSAYFEFESGAAGTCVYSGHDHYDTTELVYGFEAGQLADPNSYAQARGELRAHGNSVEWETAAARGERYGGDRSREPSTPRDPAAARTGGWILGGPLVVSYDQADVKLSPGGLMVYGDEKQWEIPLVTKEDGRDFRLRAFYDAVITGRPLQCDVRWGRATVEMIVAIADSGRERREVMLQHQTSYPPQVGIAAGR
jgi:phthalate 4,5-cis-dihydrodiol dehydrogenase